MSKVRAELSKKNPLYIDKHTFYAVYHLALQYPEWKKKYAELIGSAMKGLDYDDMPHGNITGDPTAKIGIRTYALKSRIDAVENIAKQVGGTEWMHLLYGVTHEQVTYVYLRSGRNRELGRKILCGRNQYYQMRRLFYFMLAEKMEETSLKS